MRNPWIGIAGAALPLLLHGCAGPSRLDTLAVSYVKLVLAVGRHDPLYVDSYYGPPGWKSEADAGPVVPISELLARTRSLRTEVRSAEGPDDRKRYLDRQLVAVEGYLRRLSGERMTLTEECRLLYDAEPRRHDAAEFAAAQDALQELVPGEGALGPRIEALRRAVYIPRDKLEATLAAALVATRGAAAPSVRLPRGETFDTALVHWKPWGAYNWYLGKLKSRIELNTDLPTELNGRAVRPRGGLGDSPLFLRRRRPVRFSGA